MYIYIQLIITTKECSDHIKENIWKTYDCSTVTRTFGFSTIFKMKLFPRANDQSTTTPLKNKSVYELLSLKGKVCAVTGGSRGIGAEVVDAFASAGADVAVFYYSTDISGKLGPLNAKYGTNCKAYRCDVTEIASLDKTVSKIVSDYGKIDVFVANAGVAWKGADILKESNDQVAVEQWKKFLHQDVDAVHYSARVIGRVFKEQGFGSMIITGSMSGAVVNVPQLQAAYNAAKAFVIQYAKSLAIEWVGFARVNTVSPGYVSTSLTGSLPKELKDTWNTLIPMGRSALPKEIAGAYLYLASDAATYTTGSNITVDGGYTAI